MKVKDIGGEFALIERIARKIKDGNVLTQIGDDTSAVKMGGRIILLTTDTLVEGDHFRRGWFTPFQIGRKAMEANVSDIAATGGEPRYALVSLCLKKGEDVEFVEDVYRGMRASGRRNGFEIIGGNVTHGKQTVIDVFMTGETDRPVFRSGARDGDFICVTGDLGKSRAGLELFLEFGKRAKKMKEAKAYLEPSSRLKESAKISGHVTSMIDVSDGLASEIRHVCGMSGKGAEIMKESIPVSGRTSKAAGMLGKDPYDFALHGGEDFELVFTIPEKELGKLKGKIKFSVIGKILPKAKGIYLLDKGKKSKLGKGYDHFA